MAVGDFRRKALAKRAAARKKMHQTSRDRNRAFHAAAYKKMHPKSK